MDIFGYILLQKRQFIGAQDVVEDHNPASLVAQIGLRSGDELFVEERRIKPIRKLTTHEVTLGVPARTAVIGPYKPIILKLRWP
jgi:hypothetical protein